MSKHSSYKKPNFIDKIYNSASVEFWLSIVTVGIIADWILKFGVDSIVITVGFTAIVIAYLGATNSAIGNLWYKFKRMKAPRYVSLLLSTTILGSLFLINCATDPAHALIVTASGETAIRDLLSGKALSSIGNQSTATSSASSTAANAGTNGMLQFANLTITIIKLFFAFTFIFTLYGAYQKYQERAEIQEIIQSPVVLIIVVLAIDGMLGVILGAS
jgi:hypothetical protein